MIRSRAWAAAALLSACLTLGGCGRDASRSQAAGPDSTAPATGEPQRPADAGLVSALLAPFAGAPAASPASSRPEPQPRTIASGTRVSVRLLQSLSSRSAHPGDPFEAELAAPLAAGGETLFARGARVRGRVTSAKPSGRLESPGYLTLTLAALQAPDGSWVDVDTSSVTAKGRGHARRNTTLIGGGAGLGAIIGGIAGGGKGALIGAGAGAGAGTAGAYATGRKDVGFAVESRVRFVLRRPVTVKL